jgi:hypothetical protein
MTQWNLWQPVGSTEEVQVPETVSFSQLEKIVEVRSSGHLTVLEMTTSKEEVERLFSENEVKGIFVDVRNVRSMPTSVSLVDFVDSILRSLTPQKTRFALLMTQTEGEVVREMRFIETVGVNRGLLCRLFEDEDQARQWLLEE